ncbi:MAG: glycoside hydrolase family 76 protein [Lachnospiraceae bacterium]|nr:glycoside hydrolase family 76 protein [Lachnospiraceae bacterium]
MILKFGNYELSFESGGVKIRRGGETLYYNNRPMYAFVKTAMAVTEFFDSAYDAAAESEGGAILATGILQTPNGSKLRFEDLYKRAGEGILISRTLTVLSKGEDDLGFASKISFVLNGADTIRDYDCFAPATWYKDNEYARPHVIGFDPDCEYHLRKETGLTLPLFAAQNKKSGETIMLSRNKADLTLPGRRTHTFSQMIDRECTAGSIGLSKPENKTISYLYYGFPVRKETGASADGLSIDYVYPATDGQTGRMDQVYNIDYMMKTKSLNRILHPMEEGFSDHYEVRLDLSAFGEFYPMMRWAWRSVYRRLRADLFQVDQNLQYHNNIRAMKLLARDYGDDAWGVPFSAFLPDMDVDSISLQFGFVGQQPGIGYQLMVYGLRENVEEAYDKGRNIIRFWVKNGACGSGAPRGCYSPINRAFEPYPIWLRMSADGLENILDAYVLARKNHEIHADWLEFCENAARFFLKVQNEDGSFYRAYEEDGRMRMDSKANTISIVRFFIQLFLVTGNSEYKDAAIKAGEWSYTHIYRGFEYRGSTCDNTDIMDNESGIYAMFGFLSLYDLTGEEKWKDALLGAADYTETWTYSWHFPVYCDDPGSPLSVRSISGQSPVVIGTGGGDMYMAACAYLYYRIYVITGDAHYRDYAEFIHNNSRNANDVDGSFGYAVRGLSWEGGAFADQVLHTLHHWLPWVTYVELDPASRLMDTFGSYDIEGCGKLSEEEKKARNRIYENYAKFPV